jgi:hypothetical protein
MTVAVCFKCGAFKFGAFTPCFECDQVPDTEDEFLRSMLMTDHFFDEGALKQMGNAIADGKPVEIGLEGIDPEIVEELKRGASVTRQRVRRMREAG